MVCRHVAGEGQDNQHACVSQGDSPVAALSLQRSVALSVRIAGVGTEGANPGPPADLRDFPKVLPVELRSVFFWSLGSLHECAAKGRAWPSDRKADTGAA